MQNSTTSMTQTHKAHVRW